MAGAMMASLHLSFAEHLPATICFSLQPTRWPAQWDFPWCLAKKRWKKGDFF